MQDFTLEKYKQLCSAMVDSDYDIYTVNKYLLSKDNLSEIIILRHDVDSSPFKALRMAILESQMGIVSTYYFRHTKNVFKPEIISKINDLGHEVGYHYEVLTKTKGDYKKAIELFEYELEQFRDICEINTISMHGSSLFRYDNRDIWNVYMFKDFNLNGEAYLSVGKDLNYFSDTGRSWNQNNKLRDWIPGKNEEITISTTDDLIDLIKNHQLNTIYTLMHPPIWAGTVPEMYYSKTKNCCFNAVKNVLKLLYR